MQRSAGRRWLSYTGTHEEWPPVSAENRDGCRTQSLVQKWCMLTEDLYWLVWALQWFRNSPEYTHAIDSHSVFLDKCDLQTVITHRSSLSFSQIWKEERREMQDGYKNECTEADVRNSEWGRVRKDEGGKRKVRLITLSSYYITIQRLQNVLSCLAVVHSQLSSTTSVPHKQIQMEYVMFKMLFICCLERTIYYYLKHHQTNQNM